MSNLENNNGIDEGLENSFSYNPQTISPVARGLADYYNYRFGFRQNMPYGNDSFAGRGEGHKQIIEANNLGWSNLGEEYKYANEEALEKFGGQDQGFFNKVALGSLKFTTGLVGGAGQAVLSLWDGAKHIAGYDAYSQDGAVESAIDEMSDWSERNLKIFGASKRGFNSSYIIDSFASMGTTFGIIGADFLMVEAAIAAISALGAPGAIVGGLGVGVGLATGAIRMGSIIRALKGIGSAIAMGVQTSSMNSRDGAREVYKQVYDMYGDEEMAMRAANDQFAENFNNQLLPSILVGNVVDRIGVRALGRLVNGRVGAIASNQGKKGVSDYLRRAKYFSSGLLRSATHEGLEEGFEEWVTEKAKSDILAKYGIYQSVNWDNISNSFVVGALSGGIIHGGSKIANKISEHRANRKAFTPERDEEENEEQAEVKAKKSFEEPVAKKQDNIDKADDIVRESNFDPNNYKNSDFVNPSIFPPSVKEAQDNQPTENITIHNIDPVTGKIITHNPISPSALEVDHDGNPVNNQPAEGEENDIPTIQDQADVPNAQSNPAANTQEQQHDDRTADDVFNDEGFAEEQPKDNTKEQFYNKEVADEVLESDGDFDPEFGSDGETDSNKKDQSNSITERGDTGVFEQEQPTQGTDNIEEQTDNKKDKPAEDNKQDKAADRDTNTQSTPEQQPNEQGEEQDEFLPPVETHLEDKSKGDNNDQQEQSQSNRNVNVSDNNTNHGQPNASAIIPSSQQVSNKNRQEVTNVPPTRTANVNTNQTAKAEPKLTKRDKEEAKDIAAVRRKASLEVSALEDRIDKDLESFRQIIFSERSDNDLKFYDTVLDGLNKAAEADTSLSGNQELDLVLQEFGELEKDEYRETLDIANSFKQNYLTFKDKGYSKLIATDLAKSSTKILFLKKRLSEIDGDIANIRKESANGAIDKAIEYITNRFPFLSTNRLTQGLQYKLSSRYYKQYKSALEEVIDEEESNYARYIDAPFVMSVISDAMDSASFTSMRGDIRDTIMTHKLEGTPQFKSILSILDAIDNNIKEDKHPFHGITKGIITPDITFKVSELSYLHSKYDNASDENKVLYKKRMLNVFLNVKDTLEYRNQREVPNTETLSLIYKVIDGSDLDHNMLRDLAGWLGESTDFIVTKNKGNVQSYSDENSYSNNQELYVELFEDQRMLQAAFEEASKPYDYLEDKDYTPYYDIYKNRLNHIKDSLKDSEDQSLIKYIYNLLDDIKKAEDYYNENDTDPDTKNFDFLKITKGIKDAYSAYYKNKRQAIVSPTQHTLDKHNYDKTVNNKEQYAIDNPGKDIDKEDRVLLDEDITGEKGKETNYGGEGTKFSGQSDSKGKTLDQVLEAPVKLTNSNGDGFTIPPINKDSYAGSIVSFDGFYAKAVHFSSVGDSLALQIDYNDSQSLDNVTMHSRYLKPISQTIPDDFDIEFVTEDTPPPKDGLVNREPVQGRIRHRRVLQDGRIVEMPLVGGFSDDTRKIVFNIVHAYDRHRNGSATDADINVINLLKKEYKIDITKGRGVINALGKFISISGVNRSNNTYKIVKNKNGDIQYRSKDLNQQINNTNFSQYDEAIFYGIGIQDIALAPDEELMNNNGKQNIFNVLLGEPISYKDYLKRNLYTNYHTFKSNGKFITFFNPKHSLKADLSNTDLDNLLGLLQQAKDRELFSNWEDVDKLNQYIENIKELQRGYIELPSKVSVGNTKQALNPTSQQATQNTQSVSQATQITTELVRQVVQPTNQTTTNTQQATQAVPVQTEVQPNSPQQVSHTVIDEEQNQSNPVEDSVSFTGNVADNNVPNDTEYTTAEDLSHTAVQPIDDGTTNEFSGHNVLNPISRDGTLRIGKRKIVNITGKYSDEEVLKHIEDFDITTDFVNKAIVTDVLRDLHYAGRESFNGKTIESKIKTALDKYISQFEERLSKYDTPEVKDKVNGLLGQLNGLRDQVGKIKGLVYEQIKKSNGESSYDDRPAFNDNFDSPTTQFMRSIKITDPTGKPYVDPFGMPVYYDYSDVSAIFLTAIDSSNGTIRSLQDIIQVLNRLSKHRIANDVINGLKALPKHIQNKMVMKYSKMVVDRAITIDDAGRAKDADTFGAISTDTQVIRDVIKDKFVKFNPDGSFTINRKSYDGFMHSKHILLSDSPIYRQLAFRIFYDVGTNYLKNNPEGKKSHEILADIINDNSKASVFDIINMLKVFGYDPNFNRNFLSAIESNDNSRPKIIYISNDDISSIKKIQEEAEEVKKIWAHDKVRRGAEWQQIKQNKLIPLVKKIALRDNVKTKKLINDGVFLGYTIDATANISDKPFDAKSIQKLLSQIGINVHYKAVDKFFNEEVLLDNDGNVVSFREAYYNQKKDGRYKEIMARSQEKIELLNNIILYASNLNDTALKNSIKKSKLGKDVGGVNDQFDAQKVVEIELQTLLGYHYKNNPFGTKAVAKLGEKGSTNYSSSNMVTDTLNEMKNNPREYFSIPLYQNNMLLGLWFRNPDSAEKTRIDHIHSKVYQYDDSEHTRLSKKQPHEIEYAHMAIYYGNLAYNGTEYNDILYGKMKVRSMPFPVISDKNKFPVFTVPTLSISDDAMLYGDNGFFFNVNQKEINDPNSTLTEEQELRNANTGERLARNVVDNIFGSELRRAVVFSKRSPINRKAMNTGARFFYSIPEFNEMVDENGISILDHIFSINDDSKSEDEVYNELYDKFFNSAKSIIEGKITQDVEYLLGDVASPPTYNINDRNIIGFLVKHFDKEKDGYWEVLKKIGRLDVDTDIRREIAKYYDSIKDNDIPIEDKHAAVASIKKQIKEKHYEANDWIRKRLSEYVINNMLNYNNVNNLFIGDPASFSSVKKATNPDGSINTKKLVYETATNVFKRWGGAFGTTNKLPHKEGEKFHQIILQDEIGVSTNIGYLAKLNYPKISKSDLNKLEGLIDNYDGTAAKDLANKYPALASHLDITKTDAQEYITWREAFRFMEGTGELTEEQIERLKPIYEKLSAGVKLNANEHKYFMNSYEAIINTQKPLGASREKIYDDHGRPMHLAFNYIKSSGVVLLPGFTAGTKLDSLRIMMEDLEKKTGMPVRAGYVSTMKADTVQHPLKLSEIHDNVSRSEHRKKDSGFNKLVTGATVTMNRSSWGQQQKFPNHQQEHILAGSTDANIVSSTQLQSILFDKAGTKDVTYNFETHDSIIEEFNKAFPNNPIKDKKNVSGFDLERLYGFASGQMLMANEKSLKNIMGEGWKDLPKAIADNLEVSSPGNPLVEVIRNTPVDQLMTSTNEKITSIAHSFIKNNITDLRVNGLGLVSMSSAGLESSGSYDKNRIVYTSDKKPGPLKDAYVDSDGVFHPAEVLMPSQFTTKDKRGNVIIIDLTSPKYSTRHPKTGHLVLKKGAIDERLLQGVGIRTPYSNLNSGSAYKIVGFLPQEMGNAVVLPPSIIAQKGADNDGDKEYVQLYNYEVDEKGRVTKDDDLTGRTGKGRFIAYSNVLLDISKTIYSSTDPNIQKEITKPISSLAIADTLEFVKGYTAAGNAPSLLSKQYQTDKYKSGAVGKDGMSLWSYNSLIHSMTTRASKKGDKPIVIYPLMFGEKGLVIGAEAQGNLSKADNISINQNEAVDNAKNDNMTLMNQTNETMPIYNGLIHVGFGEHKYGKTVEDSKSGFLNMKGKDGKEYNMPTLLMTTPVMRKAAELMAQGNSIGVNKISNIATQLDEEVYGKYLDVVKDKYGFNDPEKKIAYRDILNTKDQKLINLVNIAYDNILSKHEDINKKLYVEIDLAVGNISPFIRISIIDPDGQIDYKKKREHKAKFLFNEFSNNKLVDYESLLTPDNLMALSMDKRDANGNLIDAHGNVVDDLHLTTAILMKAIQAEHVNNEITKVAAIVNKTHQTPQSPGEYAAKLIHITNAFNMGAISSVGEYTHSGENNNQFDLANDILDRIVPTTSEGAKLVSSMRNIRDMYRSAYPEYEKLMRVVFDKIKPDATHGEVERFVSNIISEYNKFRRAKLFANNSQDLDNLLDFLFDIKGLNNNKRHGDRKVTLRTGQDTLNDLAHKIGLNRGSHVMWRDNKLLNALSLHLGAANSQRVSVPHVLLEDGSLTQAFSDLLQDNVTVIMRDHNEDGSVKNKYTARDVAFMLAAYANFSENNNLSRVIPDSFYEALGKSNADDIELFFDQYNRNKSGHMYNLTSFQNNRTTINALSEVVDNKLSTDDEYVSEETGGKNVLGVTNYLYNHLFNGGFIGELKSPIKILANNHYGVNILNQLLYNHFRKRLVSSGFHEFMFDGIDEENLSTEEYIAQRLHKSDNIEPFFQQIFSDLSKVYYHIGLKGLGSNVKQTTLLDIIKAGYNEVSERIENHPDENKKNIMREIHNDIDLMIKSGANLIYFNNQAKKKSRYSNYLAQQDPLEMATMGDISMKLGYMGIEANQRVNQIKIYPNGKEYVNSFNTTDKVLLKHLGDGKFMVVESYENTPLTYYNPFEANENNILEHKFSTPDALDSIESNPIVVDKKYVYENMLKPLFEEYGLSKYQKNILKDILGNARINLVNNSGTVVRSVEAGLYSINIIGDLKDVGTVYSQDNNERKYRLNEVLRQVYSMYAGRHTTKSTKAYVNALLAYTEGGDTKQLEQEHRALYPNDKRKIEDVLNNIPLTPEGKPQQSTTQSTLKRQQVQPPNNTETSTIQSNVSKDNSNLKPEVLNINNNLAAVQIKGEINGVKVTPDNIVRQEVPAPQENENVPSKCK